MGGWATGRVKRGVTAFGVEVGGMSYSAAATLLRGRIADMLPPFTVKTPFGEETFTTQFTDDLPEILRSARRGEELQTSYKRVWADAEAQLAALCERVQREAVEATMSFSEFGFSYTPEQAGLACNYAELLEEVFVAFEEGRDEVTLPTFSYVPAVTEELLRARTRPLATFTTYYDGGNAPRAHNIALATQRISGTAIMPGEEFSFNATVGKRTTENGFEEAAVILGGEFVPGVGGGVCQASTTLMNAAIRAGLTITESRPHSLTVGYVPPSCDAMVSEYSDLKFKNPYSVPVYLLGTARAGSVKFTFYGLPDGKTYKLESNVLLTAEPPPEKIVEGDEDRVLRSPKAGIASESYLLVYEGGALLSRTRLRRDTYAVVQGIRQVKREETSDVPLPEQEFQAGDE